MFKLAILGVVSAETAVIKGDKTCRAVSMEGGGTRGAYQAGALHGLYYGKENPGEDFDYDVVTGVSTGAVNTLGLGIYAKNDTKAAFENLSDTWANLKTADLYSNWFPGSVFGMINGLLWKSGVLNTAPFLAYADKYYKLNGGKILRKVNVAAADAEHGNFHNWDETEPNFSQAVVSSSSIPLVFPPQKWQGGIYMDGGAIWMIDIESAIRRC